MKCIGCPVEGCEGMVEYFDSHVGPILNLTCSEGHKMDKPEYIESMARVLLNLGEIPDDSLGPVLQSIPQPVQKLHDLVELRISKDAVRLIRTLLIEEKYAVEGNDVGLVQADHVIARYMQRMIESGEAQQLLDTINTAYSHVGCAAAVCVAPGGVHPPIQPWW